MFTGIITGTGRIVATIPLGNSDAHGVRITIDCPPRYIDTMSPGDSIALNGACMTVTQINIKQQQFIVDVSAESLSKTTGLNQRGNINLEKALRAQDSLSGHIVSGHVDGVGSVTHFAPVGESWQLRIVAPLSLAKYLAFKGSIAVNGVSLTVNQVQDQPEGCEISINLIPHTIDNTTLGGLKVGSTVNLEIDLIARYCERMLNYPACAATTQGYHSRRGTI
jgi:riboflavin synthase